MGSPAIQKSQILFPVNTWKTGRGSLESFISNVINNVSLVKHIEIPQKYYSDNLTKDFRNESSVLCILTANLVIPEYWTVRPQAKDPWMSVSLKNQLWASCSVELLFLVHYYNYCPLVVCPHQIWSFHPLPTFKFIYAYSLQTVIKRRRVRTVEVI